jgi:hypothetical protein
MGLFADLLGKIFAHEPSAATPDATVTAPVAFPVTPSVSAGPTAPEYVEPVPAVLPAKPTGPVDVGAILDGLAAKNTEGLDWKKSIVDLMKLVGMDSGLAARKGLAAELHYPGDMGDSAAMNEWLHQEVLQKLSRNGGKIPAGLLH